MEIYIKFLLKSVKRHLFFQRKKYLDKLTLLGYSETNVVRIGDDDMFHKGLNKEIIVASAKEMMEKDGVTAVFNALQDGNDTALLVNRQNYYADDSGTNGMSMSLKEMLEREEYFDFIRGDSRFKAVPDRLVSKPK